MPCPELPNELWLHTLGYLEYFDLKRCQRVCKLFYALTEHESFDEGMWRCSRALMSHKQQLPPEVYYIKNLHPALKFICFEQGDSKSSIENIRVTAHPRAVESRFFLPSSVLEERACSPMTTWLNFYNGVDGDVKYPLRDGGSLGTRFPCGTTVGDVLRDFVELPKVKRTERKPNASRVWGMFLCDNSCSILIGDFIMPSDSPTSPLEERGVTDSLESAPDFYAESSAEDHQVVDSFSDNEYLDDEDSDYNPVDDDDSL